MKKRLSRITLMVAGIITVIVILLSQSFYHPVQTAHQKAEKKTNRSSAIITNEPSEVVPSSTVQLDENTPTLLKKTPSPGEHTEKTFVPVVKIFTSYLKTLFRVIISPNAP